MNNKDTTVKEREIDMMVYKLYELTEEEIKNIEEGEVMEISVVISIIALIISGLSFYFNYLRDAKIYGKIFGIFCNFHSDASLPINLKEDYKRYSGYGYCVLISLNTYYSDFHIKDYKIEIKEGKEYEFKEVIDYYIHSVNSNEFKYDSISKINVLKKAQSTMCILQFLIEGEDKVKISDFDLQEIKLTLNNFHNKSKEILFKTKDIDLRSLNPFFLNRPMINQTGVYEREIK